MSAASVGIRRKDCLAVCYAGHPGWRHGRFLLSQTVPAHWIVGTPHWYVCEEDAAEGDIVLRAGGRGDLDLGCVYEKRVRFEPPEIVAGLDRAWVEAEAEAVDLRATGLSPSAGVGAPAVYPADPVLSDGGLPWVSIEARGGIRVGGCGTYTDDIVVHQGDRGLVIIGEVRLVCAHVGTWSAIGFAGVADDDLGVLPVLYGPEAFAARQRPLDDAVDLLSETLFTD